jgi:hypothetical protein
MPLPVRLSHKTDKPMDKQFRVVPQTNLANAL